MKTHRNAALTIAQREEVRRLHREEGFSVRELAVRFAVNPTTVERWIRRDSPLDLTTAPRKHATVVTDEYRAAVLAYRRANPHHGPVRIAAELAEQFPIANRGTVQRILKAESLSRPRPAKKAADKHINVGRHRIQLDIQQLPAVKGGSGFEYKFSAIHLSTRLKYSEIHVECTSRIAAEFVTRAMDRLPPFFSL